MPDTALSIVSDEVLDQRDIVRQASDPSAPERTSGAGRTAVATPSTGARAEGSRVDDQGRTLRLFVFDHDDFDDEGTYFGDEPIQ